MRIYLIIISLIIGLTSCSNSTNDGANSDTDNNIIVDEKISDRDAEILKKIGNHEMNGVYHYTTYEEDSGNILQTYVRGTNDKKEFSVTNDIDYYFNDGSTITYANSEKNIYYQESVDGFYKDSNDIDSFFEEIKGRGLESIEDDDKNIKLKFDNNSYSIYDSNTLDLVEDKFMGNGTSVIQKLESKEEDVDSLYDKYFNVIQNMNKVETLEEVTGKI